MPSLVRERRGRSSWLSFTLVAALVVLTAPSLVVLTFFRSLPETGIGEFKTVHRQGGGDGSAVSGSTRRLGGRHLPAGWTKAGTDGTAARRKLIHRDAEPDGTLVSNESSDGDTGATGQEDEASGVADGDLGTGRGGGTARVRSNAGGAAGVGGPHRRGAQDGGSLQGQEDKQQQQQQQGASGTRLKKQQREQQVAAEARHGADPQQQRQLGSQAREEEEHQAGGKAGENHAAGAQGRGAEADSKNSAPANQTRSTTTQQEQQEQQAGRQAGGRRVDDASGLPQPLNGQWPDLLPQGRGALLSRPGCADKHPPLQCKQWSADGGCGKNPGFMYHNCAASCGICTVRYLHGTEVPQTAELVPGVLMPTVGYGTAGLGDLTADAVFTAIRVGYRLVDSAEAREWYREDLVGWGWSASGIKREHLFISSKVHPRHLGYWSTLDAFNEALKDLQTSYVDLMMLHYPECWGGLCGGAHVEGTWQDSWAALEQLVREGKLRAAGVSNFNLDQMAELVRIATIKPALLQSNSDLLRQERALQAFCRAHGIQFQAYSSLGGQWLVQTQGQNPVLGHPVVREIAQRLGKSEAQVALRWALQHGQAVLPRTSKVNRMESNLDLFSFDLTDADMQRLDALDGTLEQGAAEAS